MGLLLELLKSPVPGQRVEAWLKEKIKRVGLPVIMQTLTRSWWTVVTSPSKSWKKIEHFLLLSQSGD